MKFDESRWDPISWPCNEGWICTKVILWVCVSEPLTTTSLEVQEGLRLNSWKHWWRWCVQRKFFFVVEKNCSLRESRVSLSEFPSVVVISFVDSSCDHDFMSSNESWLFAVLFLQQYSRSISAVVSSKHIWLGRCAERTVMQLRCQTCSVIYFMTMRV